MELSSWAVRWDISDAAIMDLRNTIIPKTLATDDASESAVQSRVRLEASAKGGRLWRNNVGAYTPEAGGFVRYGLANETADLNRVCKSADLIGIRPVVITPDMIGYTIGQFVSREIKHSRWHYTGTDREAAQLNWALLILSLGGDAAFATGEGTL